MADPRNYFSGVPYDEEQSMPVPENLYANQFLNERMSRGLPAGVNNLLARQGYPGISADAMQPQPVNYLSQQEPTIGPYDMYGLYTGGHADRRGLPQMQDASPVTQFLNRRMSDRFDRFDASRNAQPVSPGPQMSLQEFMARYGRGPATDSEMMMIYDLR